MTAWRRLVALLVCLVLGGCLYIDTQTPYDTDLDETVLGSKTGEASAHSIIWLIAWGDAGVAAAAAEGELGQINHMDRKFFSILFGLYTRTTTIVYGD